MMSLYPHKNQFYWTPKPTPVNYLGFEHSASTSLFGCSRQARLPVFFSRTPGISAGLRFGAAGLELN